MSEIAGLIFQAAQRGRAMNAARAYIGKTETDGSTTIDVPGRPSDVYVTRRGNGEATVSVVEFRGGARIAGYPVIIETDPLTGREYTSAPDQVEAQQFMGNRPVSHAPVHGASHGYDGGDPIALRTLQIIDGLVYVDNGLIMACDEFAFEYQGRVQVFPGDNIDLTSNRPATANTIAWVVVGIDLTTDPVELVAITGAEESNTVVELSPSTIPDINLGGYIPLMAVVLENGQTASPRQFQDLRTFVHAPVALSNYTATAAPTVNDDSGDGYSVGSRWYDTTADLEYVLLDASAGAAVWRLTTITTAGAVPAHTHAAADIVSGTLDNARVNWAAPSAIGGTTPAAVSGTLFKSGDGAAATPAYSFTSDPDSGLYRSGTNEISFAVNGVQIMKVLTTGVSVPGTGTESERFGAGAVAANRSTAVGSGATANNALGTGTAIGRLANASGFRSVAIGNVATGSGGDAFALGSAAVASANNSIVVGANSTSSHTNSFVLGASVSSTKADQLRIGSVTSVSFAVNGPVIEAVDAGTTTVIDVLRLGRNSSGTPAAGLGGGLRLDVETTGVGSAENTQAARFTWELTNATHSSRAVLVKALASDYGAERNPISWGADGTTAILSFFGVTAVARAAALVQTYGTADRTLSAYTSDSESGAYTGIDNAQAGTVYARLTDLNALRTAYENLRAFTEDLAQFVNSLVDDFQAYGLEQ